MVAKKKRVRKTKDDIILELERKLITKEETCKLLNSKLKRSHKDNTITEVIIDAMGDCIKPIRALPKPRKPVVKEKVLQEEHLVMHISDQHADQIVVPGQTGGLEDYNLKVACVRAEKYVDSVMEFTTNLISRKFTQLWILFYGDHVSGEIHKAEDRSYYRNMFKNAMAVGRLNAMMVRDLAPHFDKVNILCLPGNHGRRTKKKDYEGAHNNWDYLVFESMKMMLEDDHDNVNILIPDCFSFNVVINGQGFCVSHGDDVRSWNSIPWYGLERKTRRLVALNASKGEIIKYFVFGHFHKSSMQQSVIGETIINGSWLATTPYVYESMSEFSEPYQWIHGVHPKHGITWRLPVHLRDKTRERTGPKRYGCVLENF